MSGARHQRIVLAHRHFVLQAGTTRRRGRRQVIAHFRHGYRRVEIPKHGQNRIRAHGFLARLLLVLVQRQLIRFLIFYNKRFF